MQFSKSESIFSTFDVVKKVKSIDVKEIQFKNNEFIFIKFSALKLYIITLSKDVQESNICSILVKTGISLYRKSIDFNEVHP